MLARLETHTDVRSTDEFFFMFASFSFAWYNERERNKEKGEELA